MTETTEARRIAELEADNGRLRRLLDQHDAPGELRHRLRSTVAMLRNIIRRSAETHRDLAAYVSQLEDRLDAVARAQVAADEAGAVPLYSLFADELLHYGAKEGEQASLSGPDIYLRPRAGQVLALAVHELAVNAVEHGALGASAGLVAVTWDLETEAADRPLTITWKEQGLTKVSEGSHRGFGTEVLTRLVAYELAASTTLAFEEDGLRYTLCFPLTGLVGEVAGDVAELHVAPPNA